MRFVQTFTLLLSLAVPATPQTTPAYSIRAFAGVTRTTGDGGSATSALLWSPRGAVADGSGNLYVADTGDALIRKVGVDGTISTIAGTSSGFAGDGGPALAGQVAFPADVVAAPAGDLYVADTANNRVRRISAQGVISTVAGTGRAGYNGDGDNATVYQLSFPRQLAVDSAGNIFIADTNNSRIRKLTPQGRISTVAGAGVFGFQGDDGPAAQAYLAGPRGIAVDAAGNLYISDTLNNRIRKVTSDGIITTLAGGNSRGFSGDSGAAQLAQLNTPAGIAVDRNGNIFFADSGNHRIRRITPQGIITTVAGISTNGFSGDNGPATAARLNSPQGVSVDTAGNLYISDTENHRIRKVAPSNIITTVAGSDRGAGDGGPATSARLFQPSGIVVDGLGNVYISDSGNHRVRKVTPDGFIINIAGTGAAGYSGDGNLASQSQLNSPNGLALDRSGALYIADTGNHVIRRVVSGFISTIAGTGDPGNDGDAGPATNAHLYNPSAVAFDRAGNLYIADSGNNRIRVLSSGNIRNYAGDPTGQAGFAGDGGSAAAAQFNYPIALALDDTGNLFVADYFNNRIRRVAAGGTTISTFAGTGAIGAGGDGGPATQAQFYLPAGLAFDNTRTLYVADLLNARIRAIGGNGFVRTVAGNGSRADSGDGGSPALEASLASPRDLAIDSFGNIYFSDQDNNRVRQLIQSSASVRIVVNSASGIAGSIAPGEAVSIYGTQLGDRVTFDGIPAQVVFSSPNQVNAIVPAQIAGRSTVELRVQSASFGSDSQFLAVRDAAPGIFTIDGSGYGQGAVINQDGTINSATNPAPRGSIVSIYGTGQGTLSGATVRILGAAAEIRFAGQTAPGLFQVNAQVPDSVFATDRATLELAVGSYAAQPGVTLAIR